MNMKVLTDIEFLLIIVNELAKKRLKLVEVKRKKDKLIAAKHVNMIFLYWIDHRKRGMKRLMNLMKRNMH